MRSILFIFFCFTIALNINAQQKKSTVLIKKEIVKGIPQNENLTIKFIGPTKQPVKSHVKMDVNDDTIYPEMNEKGVYTDHLDPGIYKMNFSVPYWYDASIEKLKCNKNENIIITVTFMAQDI